MIIYLIMGYKIDKKDREILYYLDLDSRQSIKQIARKVGLKREVVQYRIRQLEKAGIIRGYFTLIDTSRLGYLNFRFMIKFRNETLEDENGIIEYYKKHPRFWWVNSVDGPIDLGIAGWVKDIYEFYEMREDLVERFGQYIHDLQISLYYRFHIYRRAYIAGKERDVMPQKAMFFPEKTKYDKKDLQILRILAPNARASSVEISKSVGLSVSNVIRRIRRMEKAGIIKDYRVMLDLEKLGYYWYKVEMQLEDVSIKKDMLSYFHRHPNIIYAYETISGNDIEFEMEVESYEKFREVLNQVREIFGKKIKKHHHMLWFREHKFMFMP